MNKVSIIIPTYNAKEYINTTINSCLKQRHKDIEIIIVNDGSTDGLCKEDLIKDDKIRYYQKQNEGPGIARNFGIYKAKGTYVFFLDADDEIPFNALSSLIEAIQGKDFVIGSNTAYF